MSRVCVFRSSQARPTARRFVAMAPVALGCASWSHCGSARPAAARICDAGSGSVALNADCIIIHRRLLEPREARRFAAAGKPIYLDLDDAIMFDAQKRSRLSLWKRQRRLAATAEALSGRRAGNDYLLDFFKSRESMAWSVRPAFELGDYLVSVML